MCKETKEVLTKTVCVVERDVCDVVDWVVDEACKFACEATKVALETAELAMKGANDILVASEATFGALARAAEEIGDSAAKIFNIKRAGFDFQMNAGNKDGFSLGFSLSVDMIILGKEINKSIDFKIGDIGGMIKSFVEEIINAIKKKWHK